MRVIAEILFGIGRLEYVSLAVLLVHSLAILRWRQDAFRWRLAVGWLVLFLALSAALWSEWLSRAIDGIGYTEAHLYGGIWDDEEALSSILTRWRNVWLPIYVPWLGLWLIGLISIPVLSTLKGSLRKALERRRL